MKPAAWLLLPLAVIIAAGCTRKGVPGPPSAPTRTRIGFIVKTPESPWIQAELQAARKCSERYGFDLFTTPGTDAEQLLNAIDSFAKAQVRGLIISTPDPRLGPAILAKAKVKQMKVLAVDDQLAGVDDAPVKIPFLGTSDRAVGRTVGSALYREFARRAWSAETTVACLVTYDEDAVLRERTGGAAEALIAAGFSDDRVYRCRARTIDADGAENAADLVLTQHPEAKCWLVFSFSDTAVIGAVRAIERRGFPAAAVIGIGIGAQSARSVFEHNEPAGFFATCFVSPQIQGYKAAEYVFKWVKDGLEPPADTRASGTIVTRENYKRLLGE